MRIVIDVLRARKLPYAEIVLGMDYTLVGRDIDFFAVFRDEKGVAVGAFYYEYYKGVNPYYWIRDCSDSVENDEGYVIDLPEVPLNIVRIDIVQVAYPKRNYRWQASLVRKNDGNWELQLVNEKSKFKDIQEFIDHDVQLPK